MRDIYLNVDVYNGLNGGTVLIMSWKCNFSIYLDIQAVTTLYAFYWFFMC